MREPSPRSSRLAIAGSLMALIVIGGGGFLLGRETAPAPSTPVPVIAPPAPTIEEKPVERLLSRADIVAFGNAAADAASSGAPAVVSPAIQPGQRFELYLPFGCDGPTPEGTGAPLSWRYDAKAGALRVSAAPVSWPVDEWWPDGAGGAEAIEGFWVARPWSTRETCAPGGASPAPAGIAPVMLPGQTLGLAQIVTASTPRQMRRDGRPYAAVVRVAPDAPRIESGLRLRLRGRIGTFPGNQPARCLQPGGRDQRPVCLIAVSFDDVAIENPANGEILASWTPTLPADRTGRSD